MQVRLLEEGELTSLCKDRPDGSSKYEKIMTMIEESEKLKSSLESKAEHLADQSGSIYVRWEPGWYGCLPVM